MVYNLFQYYKTLAFMKLQNYEEKVFNNWIYGTSFIMMIFFVIGYLVVGGLFMVGQFQSYYCLVALIFFFGAIFVLFMVRVQTLMAATITEKTIATLQSMVRAMEAKDIYTKGHSEDVCRLVVLIYRHLPQESQTKINLAKLKDAAMLHDIGKIAMPDHILNKPGKLSPEEFEIVKAHPENGKMILENTCYNDIADWVLYHHERMDGNGYYHIPGAQIPLEARIIAVADVFSALYTDRIYRKRYSYAEVIVLLQEMAGVHLDKYLVDLFCEISLEEITTVAKEYAT